MNNNYLRVRLNLLTYDYDFFFPLGIFMKTLFIFVFRFESHTLWEYRMPLSIKNKDHCLNQNMLRYPLFSYFGIWLDT